MIFLCIRAHILISSAWFWWGNLLFFSSFHDLPRWPYVLDSPPASDDPNAQVLLVCFTKWFGVHLTPSPENLPIALGHLGRILVSSANAETRTKYTSLTQVLPHVWKDGFLSKSCALTKIHRFTTIYFPIYLLFQIGVTVSAGNIEIFTKLFSPHIIILLYQHRCCCLSCQFTVMCWMLLVFPQTVVPFWQIANCSAELRREYRRNELLRALFRGLPGSTDDQASPADAQFINKVRKSNGTYEY